jgi:hypothetical protein
MQSSSIQYAWENPVSSWINPRKKFPTALNFERITQEFIRFIRIILRQCNTMNLCNVMPVRVIRAFTSHVGCIESSQIGLHMRAIFVLTSHLANVK